MLIKNKSQTCCFFGHRKIEETTILTDTLYRTVENLIVTEEVNTFLFGSKSEFNSLCLEVVTSLKEKYPQIRRIYVRAEFPYIDDDYKEYLLQRYENTYYPPHMINAGKSAYVERNCEMIDNSGFCVVYYDENYVPTGRRRSKTYFIANNQPKSGTRTAYDYAVKKGIKIINVKGGK